MSVMSPMDAATPLVQTAGWTLIHFVWQGSAIAIATAGLLYTARRRSARVRYLAACAGLAGMMAAPAITARLLWSDASTHAVRAESARLDAGATSAGSSLRDARAQEDARLKARAPSFGSGAASAHVTVVGTWSARLQPTILPLLVTAWLIGVAFLLG